ncbi:MAG TPA: efflux RND transporter permease subunit [Candidatus Eisenbacteria bacterium]|nr:efflux RND transporter permease subunit [Candidatus Eisenbacteria bacterium]
MKTPLGPAGRIARAFLDSKLTLLAVVASVLLGLLALLTLPREEEPQIQVPVIDVTLAWPGAPVDQVERQLVTPVERRLSLIPKLEYLYSTSRDDGAVVIARFEVGSNADAAWSRLRSRLDEVAATLPAGARIADVAPRSIDDVPVLALTVWDPAHPDADPSDLRRVASELALELKKAQGVARVRVLGGEPRTIQVEPDPGRMAAARLTLDELMGSLASSGLSIPAGGAVRPEGWVALRAESPFTSAGEIRDLAVAARDGRPVRLSEVAAVKDEAPEPTQYVIFGRHGGARYPAVTVEVTKLPGVNAMELTKQLHAQVEALRPHLIGHRLEITTMRDYGETARHKSDDLMFHLLLATMSVIALIALALGRREALVVAVAIPVTLALTLFIYRFLGYTLNRVTLFALIFSIGILVDDAIVVVENIARHLRLRDGRGKDQRVVEAVDEVGNPTILATVTVIAAILPLAFVGGLMGPYMKPIPIGASLAMLFSLGVAFVVSPWAARRLLVSHGPAHEGPEEGKLDRAYRRVMGRLLSESRPRLFFFGLIGLLFAAAVSLVALRIVTVKMLPFDNKSEFEVLLDLPPGTPLERTLAAAEEVAARAAREPEVEAYQIYSGVGAPVTFNGLVRHYDLRSDPRYASVEVKLVEAGKRHAQSHAIARRVRPALETVAAKYGARLKVIEVPPGPPVLSTLVAEVYGPDLEGQRALARQVWGVFRTTPGVVDTDLLLAEGQPRIAMKVDRDRAMLAGVSPEGVARTAAGLYAGSTVGVLQAGSETEPVPIRVRLSAADQSDESALAALRVGSGAGTPLSELVRPTREAAPAEIYHKNQRRAVYVLGDVAGREESPVYAIAKLGARVDSLKAPDGGPVKQLNLAMPVSTESYSLKWDGEWHITLEVFRDMGMAFAVVLVLIYILTVGWFRSFTTPFVIMLPIPLSLIGILPAHAVLGAFFTATSMIGFIAGAGITVRNSIILVDFIELRRRQGLPLREAVVDAGAVRFRPMVLTAAAVSVGGAVILFDPIFQGLALSLIGGEIASTAISRVAVPVLYYMMRAREERARTSAAGIAARDGAGPRTVAPRETVLGEAVV